MACRFTQKRPAQEEKRKKVGKKITGVQSLRLSNVGAPNHTPAFYSLMLISVFEEDTTMIGRGVCGVRTGIWRYWRKGESMVPACAGAAVNVTFYAPRAF